MSASVILKNKKEINLSSTIFENKNLQWTIQIRCGWCLSSDLYKERPGMGTRL
jgi:hypothetical protein